LILDTVGEMGAEDEDFPGNIALGGIGFLSRPSKLKFHHKKSLCLPQNLQIMLNCSLEKIDPVRFCGGGDFVGVIDGGGGGGGGGLRSKLVPLNTGGAGSRGMKSGGGGTG
jgi:hypothetical protein